MEDSALPFPQSDGGDTACDIEHMAWRSQRQGILFRSHW